MKKTIYVLLTISILFSYTSVLAYDYIDKKNEDQVKSRKQDIYDRKKLYEELAGEKEEEPEDLDFITVGNDKMWWPIGSKETTKVGGKLFATGEPPSTYISSGFGYRNHPTLGIGKFHYGIDIASYNGLNGNPVIAAKDGVVIQDGDCGSSSYGNCVTIDHGDGVQTRYAHMQDNSILVKKNEAVRQGQVIGKVGSTGRSTGPHLHFEVRVNGTPVDPKGYVSMEKPRPTTEVVSGDSNKQTVCLTLKNVGYNDTAVAAIMKNLDSESGFNPTSENSIGAYGIAQWYKGRRKNLEKKYPKNYDKIDSQLKFLVYELKSSYRSVNNYLLSTKYTVSDKTYYYCMHFEIPGESDCLDRQKGASTYSDYVKNGCKS